MTDTTMAISDDERDRTVQALTRHCGDGRITLDELEERITRVYAATTVAEMTAVLADLPKAPPPAKAPLRTTGSTAPVRQRSTALDKPSARVAGEIALRVHVAVYLAVIAFLFLIWLLTSPFGYPWPIWPAMSWGVAVAIHAGVHKAVWAAHDAHDPR